MTREPFDNLQVRQAIATAIDRQMICDFAFFGVCTPIQGPTGPGSPWFIDYTPYDQNLDRAGELLTEAGYADGFEMSFMVSSDFPETVRAAQVLQQQLAAINIDVSIETLEFSEWLDREAAGDFDTFMLSWIGLTDGNDYFYLQHRTGQIFNFTGFSDADFDALVDQARSISDFDARYALYEQANQILVDAAPYVYMYSKQLIQAYSADVHGYVVRSDGAVNFGTVWLSDGM
jgi:peptide/nickel transport system substrate-binding protein